MKLVIAGSRHFKVTPRYIIDQLDQFGIHVYDIDQVVSGGASGVDKAAEQLAHVYLSDKPDYLKVFNAEWDKYGKLAGPRRNGEMAAHGDALLLIWDGSSKGSASMRVRMLAVGKPIYEVILKRPL